MRRYFLLILTILIPSIFFGQSKKVWLYDADNYFAKADYASALKFYKMAQDDSLGLTFQIKPYEVVNTNQKIKKNQTTVLDSSNSVSSTDYIKHQIAMCHLLTFDYKKAVTSFSKTQNNKQYLDDKFYYGLSLMKTESYDSAMTQFEDFVKSESKNDSLKVIAKQHIQGCYFVLNDENIHKEMIVEMMDTIVFNKGTSSFAPMFWDKDKMIFTSAREGGVIFNRETQNSNFLCDLYWTQQNEDKSWSEAKNFGRPLNSSQHDASGVFNNNNAIFYTRWSDDERKQKSIHVARMIDLNFFESYKLDSAVNYPGYQSINPFVTMDGKTLYFSSNRPGGKGGMDLWKISIDELGNPVGEAKNLGSYVNSPSDEVTPFYHEQSSTLFYSSNGFESIGGLDIFKSQYDEENDFYSTPINMGIPINSAQDDAYMIWDNLFKYGYFSSDRKPCENGHCYNIYKVENSPIKIRLQGLVFDAETNETIPNALITFKDVRGVFDKFEVYTNNKGFYKTDLEQNWEVFMKATKKDYFADAANVDTRNITESTTLEQDFFLTKISADEIVIQGIEYDYDSPDLRKKSKQILDELYDKTLVKLLELNDNLLIEINSHTDFRGTDEYNMVLSQKRAKSCVDYLISKGLDPRRIKPKGYGESDPNYMVDSVGKPLIGEDGERIFLTQPFIESQTSNEKMEEYHQRNRRTAFKVIGDGFIFE